MKDLFLSPAWLGATLGAVLLAAAAAWFSARRSRSRREGLVAPALAERAGLLSRDRWTPFSAALAVLVVLGTGLALARPRWGLVTETVERRGADIAIVLDTSASMRATDVTPSRFVLARQAALSLVEKLPGDRLALVGCEGEAQVLVPLTLDSAAVALFLEAVEPGIGTLPGTSLAAGLAASAELMPPGTSAGRQVVVVSDGEDLEGGVDEAIAKAKSEGIVVHAVFVGAEGRGAPVPEVDFSGRPTGFKTSEGSPVLSRPDPALLRRLAAETGGSFSIVQPGRTDLDGVAREVDKAARRPLSESVGTNRHERFQLPLGVAVAALALLLVGPLGFLARRPRKAATALVAVAALLLAGTPEGLLAQSAPSAGAPGPGLGPAPAAASPPAPPAPAAPASLKERILSRPPFTTAHGEAVAGKKALDEKRVEEAISRFAREETLAPKDPSGAYNLGTALSKAGRAEEALAALKKAKGASRGDLAADASFNSGNVLLSGKQWEAAAAAYRDALRARPGEPDAAWNYELALRRLDQQKKQQQQQNQQQKGGPPPPPKKDDFEKKAKMSRDKAEQLLQAIARNDLEEQRKKVAEQKKQRRAGRDW
ncbi:MAG: VWA domain-containing protein [Holophagales bacterium]|nr:VWA domain-containing protein [Holophagales bacterium]